MPAARKISQTMDGATVTSSFRQFAVDPAVPPQRILLRQANDEPGDARDRRWPAGPASLARVILLRGQPAVPGEERRRCHREDFGPAVTRYEPSHCRSEEHTSELQSRRDL